MEEEYYKNLEGTESKYRSIIDSFNNQVSRVKSEVKSELADKKITELYEQAKNEVKALKNECQSKLDKYVEEQSKKFEDDEIIRKNVLSGHTTTEDKILNALEFQNNLNMLNSKLKSVDESELESVYQEYKEQKALIPFISNFVRQVAKARPDLSVQMRLLANKIDKELNQTKIDKLKELHNKTSMLSLFQIKVNNFKILDVEHDLSSTMRAVNLKNYF